MDSPALLPKALALELRVAAREIERPRKGVARGTEQKPARETTAWRYYAIAGNQRQILSNAPLALIPRLRALPQTSVLRVTALLTTASLSHMTRIRTSPSLMPEDDRLAMTILGVGLDGRPRRALS